MLSLETRAPRSRSRRERTRPAPAPPPQREPDPAVTTVYMGSDGTIHHAWCGRPLQYQHMRGGLELDFYCLQCVEHVTVPVHALARIPMGSAQAATAGARG